MAGSGKRFNTWRKDLAKLKAFNETAVIGRIIEKNSDYLALLLISQLEVGKDGDNKPVMIDKHPGYAIETIRRKSAFTGLRGEWSYVTNFDTGDFYFGLKAKVDKFTFTIISDVPYFSDIILRSTESIMRLNSANIKKFRDEIVTPQFNKEFEKYMNGI